MQLAHIINDISQSAGINNYNVCSWIFIHP